MRKDTIGAVNDTIESEDAIGAVNDTIESEDAIGAVNDTIESEELPVKNYNASFQPKSHIFVNAN